MIRWYENYRVRDRVKDRADDRAKGGGDPWPPKSSVSKFVRYYTFPASRLATNFRTDSHKSPVLECTSTGVDMAIIKLLE